MQWLSDEAGPQGYFHALPNFLAGPDARAPPAAGGAAGAAGADGMEVDEEPAGGARDGGSSDWPSPADAPPLTVRRRRWNLFL